MEPNLVTNIDTNLEILELNEDTIEPNQDININTIDTDKKKGKQSNIEKVELLFKPNSEGYSDFVNTEEFENYGLPWSKGNGNGRNGAYFGVNKYKWDKKTGKGRKIIALKLNGINDNKLHGCLHPIGNHIRKYFKENMFDGCVNCGTHSDLCIDHKNDLYNDEKVLNVNTQQVSDFQYLCNHCNIVKREVCQKTKKTGKRYGATNIKKLKCFNIDFIVGDETLDLTNPNAMIGTYWYDPVAFMEHINKLFLDKNSNFIK